MMKKKANGGIKENLAERARTRGSRVNNNAAERISIMDEEHFRCRKPIAHTLHLHVQCIFSWHLSMWLYTNSCTSHYSLSLSISLSPKFFSSIFLNVSRKSNMQNNISQHFKRKCIKWIEKKSNRGSVKCNVYKKNSSPVEKYQRKEN